MYKYNLVAFFLIIIFCQGLNASTKRSIQQAFTQRTEQAPQIDGILEPEIWGMAEVIEDFVQFDPVYSGLPSQRTIVRILYDDKAIYIGAMLYDSSPDSILKQLGQRNASLNADAFGIRLDTYNNQLDAYTFEVSASGVQRDFRRQDNTYDGVWDSAVKIHDEGWTVEMRIPYSALRFPTSECQTWGMQLYRNIRRHREMNHWAIEERNVSNNLVYWGQLAGICNIQAPLRLSLVPYLSMGSSHYPHGLEGVNNVSGSFGGGMDLHYGINESFSFDMTLMPDFSQVPSDNQVKNLSAFETVHGEQRPFFQEGMDLFNRGGLFYSRRIGGRPAKHSQVYSQLGDGEQLLDNPDQARLINAFKLSGRTINGLGIGVFNAVTDNTYAQIESIDGFQRKIQTGPTTNYNIMVFDQALSNNSSVYIINTNVLRSGEFRHANVTGAGATMVDDSNTWQLSVSGAFNQLYLKTGSADNEYNVEIGSRYNASVAKTRGNFQFQLLRAAINPDFNDNDMGVTHRNNEITDRTDFHYNIYEPFWQLRNFRNRFRVQNQARYNAYGIENTYVEYTSNATTLEYTYVYQGVFFHPTDRIDYYEPRTQGRSFVRPKGLGGWAGISSDYRKPFALDLQVNYSQLPAFNTTNMAYQISPRYRFNDQFSFVNSLRLNFNQNDVGFAGRSEEKIVFGNRDVTTVENVFSSDYIVRNDMYFSLRLRQYWSKGEYANFYTLQHDGKLSAQTYDFASNRDFNFNSFNIDLVFTWLFAPGSSLNVVWKNAILHEQRGIVQNYFDNFGLLLDSPQYNSLSLKVLYYLDYQQLRGA
ncbi:MAG: hydrolase [Bacteroidetes bacterium]|nr:MAG: hydrolase [Bacteroidota bacterium]